MQRRWFKHYTLFKSSTVEWWFRKEHSFWTLSFFWGDLPPPPSNTATTTTLMRPRHVFSENFDRLICTMMTKTRNSTKSSLKKNTLWFQFTSSTNIFFVCKFQNFRTLDTFSTTMFNKSNRRVVHLTMNSIYYSQTFLLIRRCSLVAHLEWKRFAAVIEFLKTHIMLLRIGDVGYSFR